ncbi:hypothetical protein [Salaquimonas pukyongi]|uniref:hypothetical protein n=1 Tax=Salaquimonas pukyongi TaxID=2712698 RepID=UPI00096BB06A|nr:hypothetical protein [Salaquimonas pukyongi]
MIDPFNQAAKPASHLSQVVANLTRLLDYEHRLLAENDYAKLDSVVADKHRIMNQLAALTPGPEQQKPQALEAELGDLRSRLERNMKALKIRSGAISELAGTIEDAMRSAQSDGTYGPNGAGGF